MHDISGFVDQLGIGPFHLVGHSAGVRVAVALAETARDRHQAGALGCRPATTRAGAEFIRDFIQRTVSIRGFRTPQEAHDYYRSEHPEWVEEFIELHVMHQVRRNWAGKLVLKADPDVQWITGSASMPDISYLWDMSAKATMPTLLMVGRTSNVLDEELVKKMVTVMPNATAEWFETGHYIPRQEPEEFTRSLAEFFADRSRSRSRSRRGRRERRERAGSYRTAGVRVAGEHHRGTGAQREVLGEDPWRCSRRDHA